MSAFLDDCPVIDVPGRPYPIEVRYEPRVSLAGAVRSVVERAGGRVPLLPPWRSRDPPGAGGAGDSPACVCAAHGTLSAEEQDLALAPCEGAQGDPGGERAETSPTVEGVTDVVDSGQHKVLRYDAARGLDRLQLSAFRGLG